MVFIILAQGLRSPAVPEQILWAYIHAPLKSMYIPAGDTKYVKIQSALVTRTTFLCLREWSSFASSSKLLLSLAATAAGSDTLFGKCRLLTATVLLSHVPLLTTPNPPYQDWLWSISTSAGSIVGNSSMAQLVCQFVTRDKLFEQLTDQSNNWERW